MAPDEQNLEKSKIKFKTDIKNLLDKIESEMGEPLPHDFKTLIDEVIEEIYPVSQKNALDYLKEFPLSFQEMTDNFYKRGKDSHPVCKKLIGRLLADLFQVTDGKGIENELWFHFPKIWHYHRVIQKLNITEEDLEMNSFILMSLYISLYEITLKFLTDFALVIAKKTRQKNRASDKLLNQHSKAIRKGKTISRFELLDFFRKRNYLVGGKCDVLEDTAFRDKPAHADAYVDQNGKIVIGNSRYDFNDFSEIYKKLLRFYSCIILSYMKESGIIEHINNLKQIIDSLPPPSEE